ncbi:MAG: hypothetical protein WDZ79_01185 [Candidatus Paceibacterota bacterium]
MLVSIGMVLLVIPGLVFVVWFLPVFFVLVYEEERGWNALEVSFEYSTKHFWSILLALIVLATLMFGVMSGLKGLVTDIAVGLNQGYLEAGVMNQWVISPVISLLVWFAVVPLMLTFLAVSYEWLTGRLTVVPPNPVRTSLERAYNSLPSFGHGHHSPKHL